MPVHPRSIECSIKETKERTFSPTFAVMSSKNNDDRHRFEREYFDSPHVYLEKGFAFQTVYTKPHLMT